MHWFTTLVKKDFLINSKDLSNGIAPYSLKREDILNRWTNPALKKKLKIIGRLSLLTLIKCNLILNASKAWQNIPAGSVKKRHPSKKYKTQISLVTEVDNPKTSSLVKPRMKAKQLHCEIPKFKTNCYHQSHKEINVKIKN